MASPVRCAVLFQFWKEDPTISGAQAAGLLLRRGLGQRHVWHLQVSLRSVLSAGRRQQFLVEQVQNFLNTSFELLRDFHSFQESAPKLRTGGEFIIGVAEGPEVKYGNVLPESLEI